MKDILELYEQADQDAVAIADVEKQGISYATLRSHTQSCGDSLAKCGIGSEDRVAIVMENGPQMATTFACCAPWCTVAPLNPAYTVDEFEFYLNDLEASLMLVDGTVSQPVLDLAQRLGVKVVEIDAAAPNGGFVFATGSGSHQRRSLDATALILHTSGTTARPKMVPLSQGNLIASARNIAETLELAQGDRCLNIMPLFHIHGLMAPILATLYAGATVYCSPGFDALRFFAWLDTTAATWYSAVPSMHQAILARSRRNRELVERNQLRFIRSGSASLPVQILEGLEEAFGTCVIEAYAMTEATHQMCSNPLPPQVRKPGTVGPAAGPNVRIASVSELEFLDTGEQGEIVIRGDTVTAGYLNNPAANEKDFVDGWFRTGDLGIMDEDGYVSITGRLKEIINRGGEKVAPVEIENVLLDHAAVAQVCAFAVPHEKLGEDVGAVVVVEEGATVTKEELQAFVRERLAPFKTPRELVFRDDVPKGATGKVQRIGMAERLGLTN